MTRHGVNSMLFHFQNMFKLFTVLPKAEKAVPWNVFRDHDPGWFEVSRA